MKHNHRCLIYICTCDKLIPYEDVVELIESDPLVKAIFEDKLDILVKKQINEYLEAKEDEEKKEKENSKKTGEEFFNSLKQLSETVNFDEQGPAPLPSTREERANKKKAQISKQFAN